MKRHKRRHSNQSPARPPTGSKSQPNRADLPNSSDDSLFSRHPWLPSILLFVLVVIAYFPATRGGFIWDDDAYVTGNPQLTAPDGWKKIWFSTESPSQYFPLVYSTFRIERGIWGLNPTGYHWVNILLHAVNSILLWRFLRRLAIPGCWLAAALFALHPVNVESVAWITERKNVLSLFFCLLAAFAWVRFLNDEKGRYWPHFTLALIFQAFALFSKTTACTLPAALFLIMWIQKIPITRRRMFQLVPFLALGIAMGFVTMWWERNNMLALEKVAPLTLLERVLVASHAVWFYLGKLLCPINLTFSYPRFVLEPANPLAYGWLVALIVLGVVIWRFRGRLGRGPESAAVFFVATLSPLLGFIMLTTFRWSFVADHYQYVGCIGPLALAAAGITKFISFWSENTRVTRPAVFSALILVFAVLTWLQCGMYASLETLWRTTLDRNPSSWMAHVNLGNVELQKGEISAAFEHYRKAERLHPNDANILLNIGTAYRQVDEADIAILYLERSLQFKPGSFDALNALASTLLQRGRVHEAIATYQTVLNVRPEYRDASHNLGVALLQAGRTDEAIARFKKNIEANPSFAEDHRSLGNAFLQIGRVNDAIAEYRKAIVLQPDSPEMEQDIGSILFSTGQITEATAHFQRALQLRPGFAEPCMSLIRVAWALSTNPDPAVRNGPKAIELAMLVQRFAGSDNPVLLTTLAAAFAESGRFTDAVTTGQRALQLATAQDNSPLIDALKVQIEEYRQSRPFRDNNSSRSP